MAGRPVGSLNANKSIVRAKFRRHDFDPIDKMIRLAKKAEAAGEDQECFDRCKELAGYAYPKLRNIDHTVGETSAPILLIQGLNVPTTEKSDTALIEADVSPGIASD